MQYLIVNSNWKIPLDLQTHFPNILDHISKITVTLENKEDMFGNSFVINPYLILALPFFGEYSLKDLNWWEPYDQRLLFSFLQLNTGTSNHLFMHCPIASKIWNWMQYIINPMIDLTSVLSIFVVCNGGWSPRCSLVICYAIIYICYLGLHNVLYA